MQKENDSLIFVVEDNRVYNKLISSYLKSNNFTNIMSFYSGEEVINNLYRNPDIIIQDFLLDDGMNGIDVLKKAKEMGNDIEFIFLSGQDNIDVAINTMKYGAYDYIVKDQMALKKMVNKINKIQSVNKLVKSNKRYKNGVIVFFSILAIVILIVLLIVFLLNS
ncbi:MAG: response regulator [Prolixibacteraceae bacterium]|nr:response regulator [Prolixibacteraceae bacterium]MBN2649495.1 response regulator [Prolixibacteraceae bacterium]